MSIEEREYATHAQCGFPVFLGRDGNWHHEKTSDAVFCNIIGGRDVFSSLLDEDPEEQE